MMQVFIRPHVNVLTAHLKGSNPLIQVVLGPRQVGKTTAVLAYLQQWQGPTAYYTADQLSPPDVIWLEQSWQKARAQLTPGSRGLLVLDEIQKIPRWSEGVKKCFDEDRRHHRALCVVLLGSSSLLVQRGLSESLAGRFEVVHFPHWSFAECRQAFGASLEQYIFYGGYPRAWQLLQESQGDEVRWAAYVREALIEPVLNKDILLLTPVTKPALFRQTFQLSCAHPAEILSLNKMLGQLHEAGNASTIASYLRLLEAAMLLKPLDKYSGPRVRVRLASPKLVLLNNALVTALHPTTFEAARHNQAWWGRLVENMVGAALLNNHPGQDVRVTYWRERDLEVDFIVQRGAEPALGIEVKTTPAHDQHPPAARAFLRRYPGARVMTTAPGGGHLPMEELITLPIDQILTRSAGPPTPA